MRYLVFITFMVFASCDKRCYTCTTTTLTNAGGYADSRSDAVTFCDLTDREKVAIEKKGTYTSTSTSNGVVVYMRKTTKCQ